MHSSNATIELLRADSYGECAVLASVAAPGTVGGGEENIKACVTNAKADAITPALKGKTLSTAKHGPRIIEYGPSTESRGVGKC